MNTRDDIQSQLLVLRAQSGDSGAMTRLVEQWQPRLWTLARLLSDDDEAAWDLTQETWLAVVRDLHRMHDPTRFRPWILRILRNKAADKVRRRQRQRTAVVERREEPAMEISTDEADVRSLLSALPEPDRELIARHYFDGVEYPELAAMLNVPVGTLKSRLHAARQRLRKLMERDHA
jgi:RNA polymerase sigma-70 factor (ECF subfamily)